LLQSNQFDTTWSLTTSLSVTSGQADKDGGTNAWLLKRTDGSSRFIKQTISQSGIQSFSVYIKAESTEWVYLFLGGTTSWAYFDLGSGNVGLTNSLIDSSIEAAGNGFYRCTITASASTSEVRIYPAQSNGAVGGDSDNGVYIQDAQLEQGLVATDYIETGATTATAGLLEDEPRFDYSGGASCPALLLEPQRSNLLPNSEYFGAWNNARTIDTSNQAISSEGLVNATYLEQQSGQTTAGSIYYSLTFGSTADYTTSIFAKKGEKDFIVAYDKNTDRTYFNLDTGMVGTTPAGVTASIEDFGNGWYRCSATFNAAAGGGNIAWYLGDADNSTAVTDSGGVYIYGAQIEAGSYPTSYIPTYGSSATRAKEGASDSYDQINTLDLSSSGLSGEDVSWFFEFRNNQDIIRDDSDPNVRVSEDLTNVGAFRIYRGVTSSTQLKVILTANSGTSPAAYTITSDNPKVLIKRAWSTGRIQVYVDGVSVRDEINLNFDRWYKLDLAGHGSTTELKQVLAFPTVLSNNDSEILTGATSYSSFATMATSTDLNYTLYE
jgi:hypothetical protein